MTDEIPYNAVMHVTTTWDKVRATPELMDALGEHVYGRLFELDPGALKLFGYTDMDNAMTDPGLQMRAKRMMDTLDMCIGFLGPDVDILTEDLIDLGKRHVEYGVLPEHLPIVNQALADALEETLGEKLTTEEKESWRLLFEFLCSRMKRGMK